jgi:hypothetical protein
VLLLGVGSARGQHYFGVRAGVGSGSSRQFPMKEMGTVWGLKSGGVAWKYYSAEPFLGGLEMDALWMQQGWREYTMVSIPGSDERERTGYYQRTVDVVMVPFMWQPHMYMFRQRLRVFLNAGITFSHILSSERRTVNFETGSDATSEYELKPTRDNRFGYGLCGGGGVSWAFGRIELFGEARYYIGYSDIMKNRNKYEANPLRSPLDGLQVQAGAFFRFGKGGIKSTQGNGERRRQRIPEPEFPVQDEVVLPPEPHIEPDELIIPPE